MLCDLDVPLLFVDTPVMDMRPPLKADRLYMENRIEVQNAVAQDVYKRQVQAHRADTPSATGRC